MHAAHQLSYICDMHELIIDRLPASVSYYLLPQHNASGYICVDGITMASETDAYFQLATSLYFNFFCVLFVSPVQLYCYMGHVARNKQDDDDDDDDDSDMNICNTAIIDDSTCNLLSPPMTLCFNPCFFVNRLIRKLLIII